MSFIRSTDAELLAFVEQAKKDYAKSLRILTETGTLSATRTFQPYLRVPGTDKVVALNPPDVWADETEVKAVVAGYDGTVYHGPERAGGQGKRYADIFKANPEVNVVIHVHGPYLGAWAATHRTLPILYAAAQRHTLAREIPVYIDRRNGESAFINDVIRKDANTPAILEANGGATFWGKGIIEVSKYILILEEGAYFQAVAESLGGAREFGPGVLEQQWGMGFVKKAAQAA
ncbi:MAG TPA: class II aldolase/adducin family protein [Fluviicoccus sp.]|nr:class II aldolase/adducin family protein [Fluviicoccus sp.]